MKPPATALLAGALVAVAGCSPCKHLAATQEQRQDSTHTEVVTKTYFVTDTVFVKIPAQTAERTTADSVSQLENDYATSEARINTDGTLYHDLKTKPQDIPTEVQTPVEQKDSIVYRYKFRDVVKKVEVERELSWWQKTQIYGFWAAIAALLAYLCVANRKRIVSWLAKKLV